MSALLQRLVSCFPGSSEADSVVLFLFLIFFKRGKEGAKGGCGDFLRRGVFVWIFCLLFFPVSLAFNEPFLHMVPLCTFTRCSKAPSSYQGDSQ